MRKQLLPFTIIVAFLLLSFQSFSQKTNEYRNQFKFTPAKLLDPVNPGIELSFERRYDRFATEIGGVYQTNILNNSDYTDYKGWRGSIEEKYFIRKKKRFSQYVSTEFVFMNVQYNTGGLFAKDTLPGTPTYSDNFFLTKKTYSLNFKYGFEITIRQIVLDLGLGVGIKYINARRKGIDDPNAFEEGPRHPNVFHIANQDGERIGGNVPIAFAVGFTF